MVFGDNGSDLDWVVLLQRKKKKVAATSITIKYVILCVEV